MNQGEVDMDKKLFVIAIAIGTIVITTLLQTFILNRKLDPKIKQLLWISLAGGIIVLVSLIILLTNH